MTRRANRYYVEVPEAVARACWRDFRSATVKVPLMSLLCFCALGLPGCAAVGVNRAPAAAAAGGTAPPSAPVSFLEVDADGDARITPREYEARFARDGARHESFEAADTNRDGVITLDEWQAVVSPPRAATGPSAPLP